MVDDAQHVAPPERPNRKSRLRRLCWVLLCVALVIAAIWVLQGKKTVATSSRSAAGGGGAKGQAGPTPVQAQPARKGDMDVYLTGLGSVTPLNTVTVRSRVDGQLMEVRFREGQEVSKGSLLAVIDPRPFQVQLTQAEGQMAKDREQLNNARLDLLRYKQLWQQDSIPRQQYDTQEALVRQLEGSVKVDQGAIENAKLQLIYSRITAPISGRIGLRQVDPGNIVRASDQNGLVVITQVQPITVVFPLPEDNLPAIMGHLRKGSRLPVEAWDREQKQKLASGTLLTVDNQIDPTTGTVKLKASFPNQGHELFPNQFVNARLLVQTLKDAVIVPAAAIQRGPQGTFVYIVKGDKTVALRPVTLGVTQGGESSISQGLEPGELVVVDGAERLREGGRVELKEPAGQRRPNGPAPARGPGQQQRPGKTPGAMP